MRFNDTLRYGIIRNKKNLKFNIINMQRSIKAIETIIIGTICSEFKTPIYPIEPINSAKSIMKLISNMTYKEFTDIKKNFK